MTVTITNWLDRDFYIHRLSPNLSLNVSQTVFISNAITSAGSIRPGGPFPFLPVFLRSEESLPTILSVSWLLPPSLLATHNKSMTTMRSMRNQKKTTRPSVHLWSIKQGLPIFLDRGKFVGNCKLWRLLRFVSFDKMLVEQSAKLYALVPIVQYPTHWIHFAWFFN